MSFEAIAYVQRLRLGSSPCRNILFCLANRISKKTGTCYPSIARLAFECELHPSSVRKHIAAMKESGVLLLSKQSGRRADGGELPSKFEIAGFSQWLRHCEMNDIKPTDTPDIPEYYRDQRPRREAKSAQPDDYGQDSLDLEPVDNEQAGVDLPRKTARDPSLAVSRTPPSQFRATSLAISRIPPSQYCEGNLKREPKTKPIQLAGADDKRQTPAILNRELNRSGPVENFEGAPDDPHRQQAAACLDAYCDAVRKVDLVVPTIDRDQRIDQIAELCAEFGADKFMQAVENIGRSPYVYGVNDKGWRLTLDQFLKRGYFIKMVEGNFVERKAKPAVDLVTLGKITRYQWDQRLRIWDEGDRKGWASAWGPAPGQSGCVVPPDLLVPYMAVAAA